MSLFVLELSALLRLCSSAPDQRERIFKAKVSIGIAWSSLTISKSGGINCDSLQFDNVQPKWLFVRREQDVTVPINLIHAKAKLNTCV